MIVWTRASLDEADRLNRVAVAKHDWRAHRRWVRIFYLICTLYAGSVLVCELMR